MSNSGVSPEEAFSRLCAGNERYVRSEPQMAGSCGENDRAVTAQGQALYAAVLGCADSRVPPEVVFDAGLGEVFSVRVAGNCALASQIGSLEFATTALGSRLIVVLGHTKCGAVSAARSCIESGEGVGSPHLQEVVSLVSDNIQDGMADGVEACLRCNVEATIKALSEKSDILKGQLVEGVIEFKGGIYDVETGVVSWL